MEKSQILAIINDIAKDVLDNEDVVLTSDTTASDVEEWDSLNHIQLVVAIEKKFKIRFNTQEIQTWKNVAGIVDDVAAKLS
ncbi:acyl carrier protein [Mucilaginibacter sp. HD30]